MKRPDNYSFYSNRRKNKISFKDWPDECKQYAYWLRDIKNHPEWKSLSDEEYYKIKSDRKTQRGINAAKLMRKRFQEKDECEKQRINKSKGSYYNNLSEEEKVNQNNILSQRSKNFWDSMSSDERISFSQYRWNLKSDEEKQIIIKRFNQAGVERMKNLPDDEIQEYIERMNSARRKKFYSDPEFQNKQIQLLRDNFYNYITHMCLEDYQKILKDNGLNKKFETFFRDSSLYKNYYFIKEFLVEKNEGIKFWDYAIYSRIGNKLIAVIDLDGAFYHGDNSDYNGLHSKEERDEKRGYFIPDGIKCYIITERNIYEDFKNMEKEFLLPYDDYIKLMFDSLRSIDFPYPTYHHNELINSFQQLLRLNPDNSKLSLSVRNREGDRLITHFHHSIYHAHVKGKPSPYDAWYDDKLLMKCIQNRVIYQSYLNPNKILQGFNVAKIAPKVSVFSAGRAKIIIYRYLNEFNEIFDPFSGFSGRMLGAMSLYKQYIGSDLSYRHIRESRELIDFIKSCDVIFPGIKYPYICKNDVRQIYGHPKKYECLFTCPPYGDKEEWSFIDNQDYDVRNNPPRSCDEWIDMCLSNYICKRYVFIVDKTKKYQEYIREEIKNKSHFGSNSEYLIVIDR